MKLTKAAAPLVVLTGAVCLSVAAGRPTHLPGAALSWSWLFYLERAASGLGIIAVVWLIGWRGLHGHFPIKFGNIEYAEELQASADTVDAHEKRLRLIERFLELVPESDVQSSPEGSAHD